MNTMKKIWIILIIMLSLIFSFSGCKKETHLVFVKKYNFNIERIFLSQNKIFLISDRHNIHILNLDGGIVKDIDLTKLNKGSIVSLDRKTTPPFPFKNIKNLSPKDVVNSYLDSVDYLLKSISIKDYRRREEIVKPFLKEILLDDNLMNSELERIFNNFLEIEWVNNNLGEIGFKSYRKFYEEFSKNGFLYIHARYFVLKECKVEEFGDIDFEEIPPSWIVPPKSINGRLFGSAMDDYYEFVLKKEKDTWKIKNVSYIPKSPERIEPLPDDIERDLRIIQEQSSAHRKEDYLLINGIELFNNRMFINTRIYLFMIDMESGNVLKYENYLPTDYSYGVGITFKDGLERFKVSFVNFDDEEILWEKEFNENPLFFLSSDDRSLYFLQASKGYLFIVSLDKEKGEVSFRRKVKKIEEYGNLNGKFSLVSRDRFIFLSDKKIYLINLNGDIVWEKPIDFSLVKFLGSSNYLLCLERGEDNFLLHCYSFKNNKEVVFEIFNRNFVIQGDLLIFQSGINEIEEIKINF